MEYQTWTTVGYNVLEESQKYHDETKVLKSSHIINITSTHGQTFIGYKEFIFSWDFQRLISEPGKSVIQSEMIMICILHDKKAFRLALSTDVAATGKFCHCCRRKVISILILAFQS